MGQLAYISPEVLLLTRLEEIYHIAKLRGSSSACGNDHGSGLGSGRGPDAWQMFKTGKIDHEMQR